MKKAVRLPVLFFALALVLSACSSTKPSPKEALPAEPLVTEEPQIVDELQNSEEPQVVAELKIVETMQLPVEPQVMVAAGAMPSADEEVFLPLKIEPPDKRVASSGLLAAEAATPQPKPPELSQKSPEPAQAETTPASPETVPPPPVDAPPVTIPPPAVPSDPQPPELPQEPPENQEPESTESESVEPESTESEIEESESDDSEILTPLPPVPSRSASIDINQYLDIPYNGVGWVYLGELEDPGLVSYIDRKRIGSDTVFTIRADKPGQTMLQFYREDVLTRAEVNDYFELTIAASQILLDTQTVIPPERTETRSTASSVVPRTSIQTEAASQLELQPPEPPQEIVESDPAMSLLSPPSLPANLELYDKAEKAFQAANYQEAAVFIGQSLALGTDDKGLFLKGQIYEANSPVRDLRLALNAYQQLADTFPMSMLRPDALKRITYLKRFYFTIN